jgi:hypothetical protein
VARAEACAQDFYAALDAAVAKLEARMRRSHDRRRITGRRTRVAAARATASPSRETLVEDVVDAEIPIPREHGEYLPDDDERSARPRGRAQGLARPPP